MSPFTWLSIVAVCGAGAMSPGPSLAVVIRNTLNGSRAHGVTTGLSHALGILFYAFVTAAGIGVLVTQSPAIFNIIKYLGAAFLLWLGYRALTATSGTARSLDAADDVSITHIAAFREGLMISILNPKIIMFFLALFSQFVGAHTTWLEVAIVTLTAGVIDGAWYVVVALFVSQAAIYRFLKKRIAVIEKVFGVLLIFIALRVVIF